MKARLVLACALVGAALAIGGAGTAGAATPAGSISFTGDPLLPGERFHLKATCQDTSRPAPFVRSSVLVEEGLYDWFADGDGWRLDLPGALVRPDARPGAWPVTFTCAGTEVTRNLVVAQVYAAIGVQDEVVEPGQEVLVTAGCHRPDFAGSPVESDVLDVEDLIRDPEHDPVDMVVFADGRVHEDVRPGTYQLSFTCVDRKVTNTFTVTAPAEQAAEPPAQVPVKPIGAPETGSLEPTGDPAGVVAVLLGAGGLGAALVARRRRRV
ncbi:MAG TPA: hypothetical protein VHH15_11955 [Actinophytocola sp.]|nr:hypothetical protein [Actinophytocola sp.]